MKRLNIGDKAFIYFHGYEVRGIISSRSYRSPSSNNRGDNSEYKGDYWNYYYRMIIDDEHILENYDMETIEIWFKKDDEGNVYKDGRGNGFFFDKQRTRKERLDNLLNK